MNDRPLLERYTGRRSSTDGETEGGSESDGNEDFGAFGWLRGPRERAAMLELRKKDGAIVAVAYGFINRVEFNPGEGIILRCGQDAIRIKGRRLNAEVRPQIRLFQGITRHRVPWIQEADPASLLRADKNAVIVEFIEW
jgi:hypothetical protein